MRPGIGSALGSWYDIFTGGGSGPVSQSWTPGDLGPTPIEQGVQAVNAGADSAAAAAASAFDPQTYRDQINRFQAAIIALGTTADQMSALAADPALDPSVTADAQAWLDDFVANKGSIVAAANTINAAVNAANAVGANMPSVAVPSQLGVLPAAIIAGIVAATAAIAYWLGYCGTKQQTAAQVAQNVANMISQASTLAPADRARVLANVAAVQRSSIEAQSSGGVLGSFASIIQWVAIGAAAYFAYKAFTQWQGKRA